MDKNPVCKKLGLVFYGEVVDFRFFFGEHGDG